MLDKLIAKIDHAEDEKMREQEELFQRNKELTAAGEQTQHDALASRESVRDIGPRAQEAPHENGRRWTIKMVGMKFWGVRFWKRGKLERERAATKT